MKKRIFTKLVPAVSALVLLLLLTSCTIPFREPAVGTEEVNGCPLPRVSGFIRSDAVNATLSDVFSEAAATLDGIADASDGSLQVVYHLQPQAGSGTLNRSYLISMGLSDGEDVLEVMRAKISGISTVTVTREPSLDWMTSPEVAQTAILLQRIGMETDFSALEGTADEAFTVQAFIELYETLRGQELDVSDIAVGGEDILFKKAAKLGVVSYFGDEAYQFDSQTYVYTVENAAEAVMRAVERDVYGRQSESVTGAEFAGMIFTLRAMIAPPEAEDAKFHWSDLGQVDMEPIFSETGFKDKALTRRDGAELVGRLTKSGPQYSMRYRDNSLNFVDDSDSIWVRRAVTHGFMNYYGDSVLFAPDEGLTVTNAIQNARAYVMTRYNDWAFGMDYAWDGSYSKVDVMLALGQLARYFDGRPEEEKDFEVKSVINDRDYDWFFSQKNTGDYSGVNCMPSIATMAAHWYNQDSKATVKKMRATNTSTDGWTAYELRGGLDAFKVPYEVKDNDLDTIVQALDDGKIVLAQYSDRPYEMTGHCYVIYGYRRFKDSTTFIINDSDSLVYQAELYGRKAGNGDEVEGNFSLWSIQRFVSDVTVVG